jgi:hypothetical protein
MRRIDIFVSSPEDVQKERSLVERAIRAVAGEFSVPVTVTYSNWLRQHNPTDKIAAQSANGSEDGRTWLCPCFWEYRDSGLDEEYREQIPNTGSYDLVISILWSKLGTRLSPAFVMPDGSRPHTANQYEIGWVLDQVNRTPGFPELRVYRNRSVPPATPEPRVKREAAFREWDAVQEFFAAWEKQKVFAEACSSYSDLQEFEILFREHFRDFLTRQLEKEIVPRKKSINGAYWKSEPYRGLQFFDFQHAHIFHGRTKAVGDVLDALEKQAGAKTPFVLVLGASGAGKSSLVRAGVLPLLTEIGTTAGQGPWRYAITRPGAGGDPFESLAAALLSQQALPELQKAKSRDDWRKLAANLKEDPEAVAFRIKELAEQMSIRELDRLLTRENDQTAVIGRIEGTELARHRKLRRPKPKAKIALFVDQLEELFTGGFSLELQQQYFAAIAALVRSESVYVIAALGSNYYATYHRFSDLVALTTPSGRYDLQPPTRGELEWMVRSPAEASGLKFERQLKSGRALDDALVESALLSVDQLPLLEHALSMLYRKQADRGDRILRWSDYKEFGGLDGALAHHAEEVFTKLSSDARQAFSFVMRRLAPIGLDEMASGRVAFYRDLVSAPELDSRLRTGAKTLVDSMVKEGLFTSETDFGREVVVRVADAAIFRKWPRVREWLIEDQEFLRMRDRVDGCLKQWLKQGRDPHELLSPALSLADGETLLNHFQSSLSDGQIEYIRESLKERKKGRRLWYFVWLPLLVGLVSLVAVVGVRWFNNESLRTSKQQFSKLEQKLAEFAKTDRGANQTAFKEAEEKAEKAQRDAELFEAERDASDARLKDTQELAKRNSDLALAQRGALDAQFKQVQAQFQQAQQNADLASGQRASLESQLKQVQEELRQGRQNSDLTSGQRTALESQLKQAQDKLQQAQQNADLTSGQRTALEAQLKQAQDKLQQAQQSADLASGQRTALEAQLKQAQDKLQQAQQNVDLTSGQRIALENQLKQAQEKLQQAQTGEALVSSQRMALETQLKQAQDKLQQGQQNADLVFRQRNELETQLKQAQQNADPALSQRAAFGIELQEAQDKLQKAQQNADLASTQRTALETQLKEAQDKLQQSQQNADLVSTQRIALENQLKQAEDKLQQAQRNVALATALDGQLKQAQDKLQQAQQNADQVANQRTSLENQLKKAEDKLQLAQQNADLASGQRASLETQLKQAQDKLGQAQQNADLAISRRASFETQLKQAQDKLGQTQQAADLAASQRGSFETQLKQAQDKLGQTQQAADLAASQRGSFETQLKEAQDKLRQAQQNDNLASAQRASLEDRLKKAEEDLQFAQAKADLAATQRSAMEAQLKQAQEKAELAQKIADLVAAQARPEGNGTSKSEPAKKNGDAPARSGRALPLDGGQSPQPGFSTQPLIPPVQPPNH